MGKISVLFVCLGNICRSPTAHATFQQLIEREGLSHRVVVDSAGTGDWHIGHPPDPRSTQAARRRAISLESLTARLVIAEDFYRFNYLLAMDQKNLQALKEMAPANFKGQLGLFLDFAERGDYREVPDPYYAGHEGFELVLDLVEDASQGLLTHLRARCL